jgi:hypothetical protein
MLARSALAIYGSEGTTARNHEFLETYEGKIIPFPNLQGENVENIEITNHLRSLLRSWNPQGVAMTDPTREEFDAKLTTVEAHTQTRFVELGSKIDRVGDSVTALNSTVKSELGGVKSELTTVKADVKADNKSTRWTIVLAILTAIGALWVTQSNLLSAFQTGLLLKPEKVAPSPLAPRPLSTP